MGADSLKGQSMTNEPQPLTREERDAIQRNLANWARPDPWVDECVRYEATVQALEAEQAKLVRALRAVYALHTCRDQRPPMPPFAAQYEDQDDTWCVVGVSEPADDGHIACSLTEREARDCVDALNAVAHHLAPKGADRG